MNDIEKLLKLADKAALRKKRLKATSARLKYSGPSMALPCLVSIISNCRESMPSALSTSQAKAKLTLYDPAWQRECEAEMQAKREIARRETLAEMNRERKSALDQVFSEFRNIFGGLEE
jgi:hypothetical protein